MARLLISAALILLPAVMFLVARPKFQNSITDEKKAPDNVENSSPNSTSLAQDSSFPSRTKSKDRIVHRKPTLAETENLLRNTIIPRVDIEDLSVGEAANTIRLLIQDAGIEPHELQIVCDMTAPISEMRIRELRIRNIPLAVLLRYICDSTKLRYYVSPGAIEFGSMTDDPFEGVGFDGPDPFEEPEPVKPILDPDDPFAEP